MVHPDLRTPVWWHHPRGGPLVEVIWKTEAIAFIRCTGTQWLVRLDGPDGFAEPVLQWWDQIVERAHAKLHC